MICAARARHATAKPSHDGRAGKLSLRCARATRRQRRQARASTERAPVAASALPIGKAPPGPSERGAGFAPLGGLLDGRVRAVAHSSTHRAEAARPARVSGARTSAVAAGQNLITVTVPATRLRPPENRGRILSIIGAILPLDAETPHVDHTGPRCRSTREIEHLSTIVVAFARFNISAVSRGRKVNADG